ncbi:MAG: endonuclease/exonuclease/phosphatase family protein [Deltaproteobacteria bacterium]|nr:endonuclease/exonuclease/phosphatase family protein [Deltaproteobacteria bacterium]
MRFVHYNICYATGPKVRHSMQSSARNLARISAFLRELEPDLVGLIEVDHGSYRSGGKNQAEQLADALGHYHCHSIKYAERSFWRHVPVLRKQGNAFLTRGRIRNETFHFFEHGMKRLVIELELEHLVVYLVHLALGSRVRHRQLGELFNLVKTTQKPCLVTGDFNALWGEHEINLFLAATGLKNANNESLPTFPSNNPRRHLDFILHSKEIEVRDFQVPPVQFSDHLPLVADLDVQVETDLRKAPRPPHCYCPYLKDDGPIAVGSS